MKLVPTRTTTDRFEERSAQARNYAPLVQLVSAVDAEVAAGTGGLSLGGVAWDRVVTADYVPGVGRWLVWASGLVDPADANGGTVALVYQKDNLAVVTLVSGTWTGAGFVKKTIGPVDVFATAGVPAGETLPIVRLVATKATSGTMGLTAWTIWSVWIPGVV